MALLTRSTSRFLTLGKSLSAKTFSTEVLHNSLSDGVYDIAAPPNFDRPLSSQDARVARARATYNSLSDPGPSILHDSLSEGNYGLPPGLLATSRTPLRAHGHRSAGPSSLPRLQRVSAFPPRHSMSDPQPLHNSYSHVDYAERK